MTAPPAPGFERVRLRTLLASPIEAWFPLRPGDRALVSPGEAVVRGAPLAERLRDARTDVVAGPAGSGAEPGTWWVATPGRRKASDRPQRGELLFRSGGRWRIGTGEPAEALEAPFAGIVREVRAGAGLTLQTPARGLLGADALGGPSTGRLQVLTPRDGHVRASEIDVGGAGAILVAGSHIDAEAITRARAVGVRGIIISGLGVKERRAVRASERRARAGAREGRTVASTDEPACLVIEDPGSELPQPDASLVRVTAGPLAGVEGTWAGLAGPHRFSGGVTLEAGLVRFGERAPVAVPLRDLERFA